MTRLLVSVRSADEARAALAGGADIIDVKEPRHGSLGAAPREVRQAIAEVVGSRPLSFAFGELRENIPCDAPAGSFAKVGPAGLGATEWQTQWDAWRRGLPAEVTPVAVAYADYVAAESPEPRVIAEYAAGRSPILLLDTWNKQRGGILEIVAGDTLHAWLQTAREVGLQIALAGSLRFSQLETVRELQSEIVAVRGGVCRDGREGALDAALVREWTTILRACPPAVVNHSLATKFSSAKLSPEVA